MNGAPPTPRAGWAQDARSRPGAGAYVLLALLALALYAPYLGAEELHYEEARRALPARAMLATGDFVLPTIWGRAYLSKPPLAYWCIAAAGALRGAVDDVAARLPSLLATVATALGVLHLGARWFSRRAGLAAALAWLLSPAVFNKGALGEIEALLALCVFATLGALPAAAAGAWRAAALCGLGLGAALLAKGPPGLVFFAAGWLALARVERPAGSLLAHGVLVDARLWSALALGLALVGVWVALLLARLDVGSTLATWSEQLDRSGGPGLGRVLGLRFEFVFAFLGGVLAATLAGAVAGREAWRALRGEPAFAWILGTLALALVALALAAPRHRYAYPLTPLLALAGGALFDRRCALDAGRPAGVGARWVAALFALAGLALGAALVPA
ncbi:MAG TPA: glycosyltransferase family 39 protein, partial [Planctomycetota bacterium]|nr:glycosyltransferase family 39 protein [Planctomycetota bacterium]